MLRIRDAQMVAFEAERRRRFVKRAARYLQELGPGGEGEEALRATAAAAWDMAARYDVRNEHDVMRLVGLCHIFGAELDADPRRPWVREVLTDPQMSAGSRVRVLWTRMRAEG